MTYCLKLLTRTSTTQKLFLGNQKPHVNKVLGSAIMKRSRLKNKLNKTRKAVDISNYNKQLNLVVKINNECKRTF